MSLYIPSLDLGVGPEAKTFTQVLTSQSQTVFTVFTHCAGLSVCSSEHDIPSSTCSCLQLHDAVYVEVRVPGALLMVKCNICV